MNNELDIGPLSWVKDEIELSLAHVAELLHKYASQQDATVLDEARMYLHQSHGALTIVGLAGITEFSHAIERLLDALAEGEMSWSSTFSDVAQDAIAALRQYLDELIAGRPNQPLRLLPVYRHLKESLEARTARDEPDAQDLPTESTTESAAFDLFFPDLTQRPPKREGINIPLGDEAKQTRLKAARLGFERGLAKWLEHDANTQDTGIREMRNSIAIIEALQDQPATRAFWWVTLAYFDALAAGGIADDAATQRLCQRIGAQVRKLLDGALAVAERLMRDVLYGVATTPASDKHIELVRSAYRLRQLVPVDEDENEPREALLRKMRESVSAARSHWDQFCAGVAIALPRFHEQSTQLMQLAQQLGHVDLARLVTVLANTANVLRKNPLLHTDMLADELATALLLAENAIRQYAALDSDFAPQVDELTSRLTVLQCGETVLPHASSALQALARQAGGGGIKPQVVLELRADLQQLEVRLDAYFRNAASSDVLADAVESLQKIVGKFKQLGQLRAVEVTLDCAQRIERFIAPGYQRQPGEFEEVAKKVSALDFFAEQLQRGPADLDVLLAPMTRTVVSVPSVENELSHMARMARTLVGTLRDAPLDESAREVLRTELKQNLEGVRESAHLVADEAIERRAGAALDALNSEAPTEHIEAVIAPLLNEVAAAAGTVPLTAESARLAQASADEIDSELLSIFVEEVLQMLEIIGTQRYRVQTNPNNAEAFTILRRCFHMLKGSSRMVGLHDFSSAVSAVETTITAHLKSGRPMVPELHKMLESAQHVVSEWADKLQQRTAHDAAPDISSLLQQCEVLKRQYQGDGEESKAENTDKDINESTSVPTPRPATEVTTETAVETAAPLPATITLGPLQLAPSLYHLYLDEVQGHLAILQQSWQHAPTSQMIRAAHTLASTSATIGIVPVQTLAHALENVLERFAQADASIDAAQDTILQLALQRLAGMVASIAEKVFPIADDALAARLDGLQAVLQANVASVDMPLTTGIAHGESPAVDRDLLPLFLEECQDQVPVATTSFDVWRKEGNAGAEALQRILHTLKGSARMVGIADIGEALHDIETRIISVQIAHAVTPALIDELENEFDRIVSRIDALRARPEMAVEAQRPMLRVRADLVDAMVNESGEIAIARSRIEGGVKSLRASIGDLTENVSRLRTQLRELEIQAESRIQSTVRSQRLLQGIQTENHEFDPLEMDRFTRLQELTRILAESVNDVATVEHTLVRDLEQVDTALTQQARLSRELSQRLMGVRMVTLASIAERLQRVVRLTGAEAAKKVAFAIVGGDAEIDRSLLDRMIGPIEHLLRNAVVHGIEPADKRAATGKAAQGEVTLTLLQVGNEVVITIGDDGSGLDYARIRAEAEKRGLVANGVRVSDAHLVQMIYQPGFTTADSLSEIAGRGVGMDVVRNETTALGGRIEIDSQRGHGTRFSLHLPLTMAVLPVVLVKLSARIFAIPSSMVVHASEMKAEPIAQIRSATTMEWEGQNFPWYYLPRLLGDSAAQPIAQQRHWVILLRGGAHRMALEVDALIGNEEVVIKNIGPQLARMPGISGATVLGDGEVVLIVNPVALVNAQLSRVLNAVPDRVEQRLQKTNQPQQAVAQPLVMVVDDSLTVRKITSRLLERAGYRVATAKDGVDALEQLADVLPIAVLADIEMPRMDGFELLRRLRADVRFKSLPVIMITSRIADKHRNYALELGANHYLGKPYDEVALLGMIAEYVAK
jgi:chemosensory pili system protein ChpA (sensor histidine kinase/response regulator)